MSISDEDMKKVVRMTVNETVPHAVKETLIRYGIDADNPIEVQKDQMHLRKWRTRLDTAAGKTFIVAVALVIGFGSQMFGAGVVDYISKMIT